LPTGEDLSASGVVVRLSAWFDGEGAQ